jgi:hypothetical protein
MIPFLLSFFFKFSQFLVFSALLLENLNDLRIVAKRSAEKTKNWENLKKKLSKNGII